MRNNNGPKRNFGNKGGFRSSGGGGRKGGFRRNNFGGEREMHKAICSECKKECEVPFKPTKGRPVYCKECFAKNKPKRF